MYKYFRSLLFRLDPETAHSFTINVARIAGVIPGLRAGIRSYYRPPRMPVEAFGLKFTNPVGLAAGYDKDGLGWRGLSLLGFGHIELGTVTPLPQFGNPRPRVFRLTEDESLINRMGFPGRGAEFLRHKLVGDRPRDLILGVNIGKNQDTPLDSAKNDYIILLQYFAALADYLVINISSPNTIGLRRLQARKELENLLEGLVFARQEEEQKIKKRIPMLVKLAPDLSDGELYDAVDVITQLGIDGIVATNTSTFRDGVDSENSSETGGLSGRPLTALSTDMVRKIYSHTSGSLPVIGSGGVMNASDAEAKLDAGAVLIQVYTGLVYRGPGLVREILNGLSS